MLTFFEELKQETTFLQSIRLSLGISEEEVLTNEFILNPIFYDIAKLELEELLPCLYEYKFTPQELARIKLAFSLILASLIAPSLTGMVDYEVKTIDVTWKRKLIDYNGLKDDLMNRAKDLLRDFECYSENQECDLLFYVAPSKRAVGECKDAPGTVRDGCGKSKPPRIVRDCRGK